MDAKELEALNLLHHNPIDENGGVLSPPFPVVHYHILFLDHIEGEVFVLASHGQVSDLLPIGYLIIVRPTTVVSTANLNQIKSNQMMVNDGFGVMPGRAVMSQQGVQEGTEHAPLRGPHVEDQRGRCVDAYPYHLGTAHQEVQDPVAE